MFGRLQEQRWAIYAVLYDEKASEAIYRCLNPTEEQWTQLGDMTKVLKPLQVATTALCEAEIISVSLVYPIINSLVTKHLLQIEEDSTVVRQCKKTVKEDLQHCFTPDVIGKADKVPILASALDPRYLHLSFLTVRQHSIAIGVLKEKCKEIFPEKSTHTDENNEASDQEPLSKKKTETALSYLLGNDELEEVHSTGEEEVDRYMSEKALSSTSTENILEWWKRHADSYPILSCLANVCYVCLLLLCLLKGFSQQQG